MVAWLYAVAAEEAQGAELTGVCGGPLRRAGGHGLRLVYELVAGVPSPTRDAVLGYGSVVQRLCEGRQALPFRYGTSVGSEQHLLALLDAHADAWERRLRAVAGQSEFIVHVERPPEPPGRIERTGTSYLTARAHASRRTEALRASLASALAPGCRDVRALSSGRQSLRLACLAAPGAGADLRARLEEWQRAHPEEHAQVTGPWPPFSFAEP